MIHPSVPSIVFESQALLSIVLHLAIASAVTVHVLMSKRDVPAAIGWIGLAWLSPFFGASIYLAFGINRVKRRARRLRDAVPRVKRQETEGANSPITPLNRAIAKITGQALEAGNIVVPLQCGNEAYPQMLDAIESSKLFVMLSSYIFRDDEIGQKFIAALASAHERGVMVRVLIDGFGGGFFRSTAYRDLRRRGVMAARFLHSTLPWKIPLLNLRLHKKVLISDGRVAFVGGLNIGAENLIGFRRRAPVQDIHFRIEGPVIEQLVADFRDDWLFMTSERLDGPLSSIEYPSRGRAFARTIPAGPDQDVDQLVLVLLSAINSARSSVRIATPYFLPDEQLITALQLAALRGVDVRLVIPAKNDHWLIACAEPAHIGPLLDSGCRIWLGPAPFDHSKVVTIDNEWCLIGSPNWDFRSLRLNFELAMEICDTFQATELAALVDRKCTVALTAGDLSNRRFIKKLRDQAVRLLIPYL